jgi:hypothetical protein
MTRATSPSDGALADDPAPIDAGPSEPPAADAARRRLPAGVSALGDVLWPPSERVWVGRGRPPRGYVAVESYAALPDAERPRLLVPTRWPRAAAASLRQFNQSMSQLARIRKAAIGAALAGAGRVAGDRVTVALADGTGPDDAAAVLIGEHLRRLLGTGPLTFSVTLGPVRPNMKPVLQLLEADGGVVGYAKLAWNDLTSRLVAHEASVLATWGERPPATFHPPRLVRTSAWRGRQLTVTEPAPHPLLRRGPRNAPVPLSALREIIGRGGAAEAALRAHPYWSSLRARAESVAHERRRDDLRMAMDRVERTAGATELAFGAWHGDLAPGNTSLVEGRWHIWDWERSDVGVPAGLDPIHLHYQLASFAGGRRVAESARAALEGAAPTLRSLGVPAPAQPALLSCYLLERFVRYEEARPEGTLGDRDAAIDQVVALLKEDG